MRKIAGAVQKGVGDDLPEVKVRLTVLGHGLQRPERERHLDGVPEEELERVYRHIRGDQPEDGGCFS